MRTPHRPVGHGDTSSALLGLDGMRDVAIDEWMGASPIYTRRMQKLLGFEGDDVETIFKGMQLDIGAPPQFMDFRYSRDRRPTTASSGSTAAGP